MKLNLFKEYRGLSKGNYILFFGKTMTALGSMVWPLLTFILSGRLMLSAKEIALIFTLYTILMIPLNFLGGKLADKYNKKNIIIICDLISVISFIYCGLTELSVFSMCIYAAGSLLQSMEMPSYSALVSEITLPKDRERAYSLNYLGTNLGMILSPTLGGLLYKNHLNLVFFLNGLSIFLSTSLIFFFFKETKVINDSSFENIKVEGSIFKVFKLYPILLIFLLFYGVYGGLYNQYSYLIPLDLARVHGDNGALIYGSVNTLNCIVVVIFTPLFTRYLSKLSEINKMTITYLLIGISYILFNLFLGKIFMYYILMMIFTWGEVLSTLALDPYISRRTPNEYKGRMFSLSKIAVSLFASLGQLLSGFAYDSMGSNFVWIITIILCFIGFLYGFRLNKKDKEIFRL